MATVFTKTLKPSGGDYTSVAAWQTANGGATSKDLVTNDEAVVLECYKGDYSSVGGGTNYIVESVTITGWTCGNEASGQHITIKCPSTEKHDGTPQSGFHWKQSGTYSDTINCGNGNTTFLEDLDLENTTTITYRYALVLGGSGTEHRAERCILNASGTGANDCFSGGARDVVALRNCLCINAATATGAACIQISNFADPEFENVTCIGGDHSVNNLNTGSYDPKLVNCVFHGHTTAWYTGQNSWDAGTDYNASETVTTTSLPGSNNYGSNTADSDFEDVASDDYSLPSGSNLVNIGSDLSATFTDDILANTRGASFDIGAFEYIAVGGGSAVPEGSHSLMGVGI